VTVAAVLLVLWALTSLVPRVPLGPLDRLATAAAAWSMLAAVPAVVVVGLALRSRSWVTAGAAGLAGVLPWVFVAGYGVPDAPPASGSRVSVLLIDADGGRAGASSIVAATARQRVDVLVVTEATPLLTHDLAIAGLDPRLAPRWVSTPPGSEHAGIVVYSRPAIASIDLVPGTRWPAARVTLDTGRGRVALVVGRASPPGQGTGRWRSDLDALGAAARTGGPAVLAGTLDATPDQAAFRGVTSGGLADAAAVFGRGLRPTWPSWSVLPLLPLDHVVVGGGVGVRSIATLPVAGTSHRAIVAGLVVPDAVPADDG
jgi:endonuclease/exonuclease/phosphatase (EEP) superfamily protein YafD